jgi:hypothetical protein
VNNRETVYDRQEGVCWWCGRHMGTVYAIHHRRLRSQGGTNDLPNLVALHHSCHNGDTGAVHSQVALAHGRGFIVHSWDDPAAVEIQTADGWRVTLADDSVTKRRTGNGW